MRAPRKSISPCCRPNLALIGRHLRSCGREAPAASLTGVLAAGSVLRRLVFKTRGLQQSPEEGNRAVLVIALQGDDCPPNWIPGVSVPANTQRDDDCAGYCAGGPPELRALEELPAAEYETEFAGEDEDRAEQPPQNNRDCRPKGVATRKGLLQDAPDFRSLILRIYVPEDRETKGHYRNYREYYPLSSMLLFGLFAVRGPAAAHRAGGRRLLDRQCRHPGRRRSQLPDLAVAWHGPGLPDRPCGRGRRAGDSSRSPWRAWPRSGPGLPGGIARVIRQFRELPAFAAGVVRLRRGERPGRLAGADACPRCLPPGKALRR
jgi:hypothetical protein